MLFDLSPKSHLKPGDAAPDFSAKDQHGKAVALQDMAGKWVVLYFYPKDDTPGCTAEACAFRDQYTVFQDAGAEVIGVSSDSEKSHQKFVEKHRLPFTLLADGGGKLAKAYGVKPTLGLIPGRVTFVIGPDGKIKKVFDSQFQATKHVEEALATIQKGK